MKSGFVGIIGRPNVGKSTLLNSIIGEKVAITSNKAQTTRNAIRGIYTDDECQIVFIDTPGIHKPKNKLGSYLTNTAVNTLNEVDVILFLVDDSLSKGPGDRYILELLKKIKKTPKILIINKIDLIGPEEYRGIYEEYEASGVFDEIVGSQRTEGTEYRGLCGKDSSRLSARDRCIFRKTCLPTIPCGFSYRRSSGKRRFSI